mgnify:FL=1
MRGVRAGGLRGAAATVALLALVSLSSLAAGCSADAGHSPTPEATAPVGPPVIVAVDPASAPLAYAVPGGHQGMEVEYATALGAEMGRPVEFRTIPFGDLIDTVAAGEADMAISGIFSTDARKEKVDFVEYSAAGTSWLDLTEAGFDPTRACGFSVGAVAGTVQFTRDLPERSAACEKAGDPPISIVELADNEAGAHEVLAGNIDAFVADTPIVRYLASRSKGRMHVDSSEYDVQPYGIAIAKGSPLRDDLHSAVTALADDGTFARLSAKWGIDDPRAPVGKQQAFG